MMQVPLLYWFNGKCVANDSGVLLPQLRASASAAALALAAPTIIAICFSFCEVLRSCHADFYWLDCCVLQVGFLLWSDWYIH